MGDAFVPMPRDAIRDTLIAELTRTGRTVAQIGQDMGRSWGSGMPQDKYAHNPIWHARSMLLESIARRLSIGRDFWGPEMKFGGYRVVVDQEIGKLRRTGRITDLGTGRLGVFRWTRQPVTPSRYPSPDMSGNAPTPAPAEQGSDPEIAMRRAFLAILTKGKKNNTYKFMLAKVLLDYSRRKNETGTTHNIPYRYLASNFLRHYWYQEYKFRIKQDFYTERIPKVIHSMRKVFGDSASGDFKHQDKDKIRNAEERILRTVFGHNKSSTSLVVPLFQNTGDHGPGIFYDYDDDKKVLFLRPEALAFFKRNYGILSKALLAEWAKFLEKTNDSLPRLVSKIERPVPRRGPLTAYRRVFSKHTTDCFYCGSRLQKRNTHVDHFIPWSYIYDDNAWNLVLACQECNIKERRVGAQGLCGEDHREERQVLSDDRHARGVTQAALPNKALGGQLDGGDQAPL